MFAKSPLAVDKHRLKCLWLSSLLWGEGVSAWWFLGLQNLQSLPDYINCACSMLQKKSYTRQNLTLQLFQCTPRLYSKELSALYQNSSCICNVQSRNQSKWVICAIWHFNLVISKMVWVKLWYWNFEQLTSLNWLLQLHRHPYSADLHVFEVELPFSFAQKMNLAFVVVS